jgi:hypothetical protein
MSELSPAAQAILKAAYKATQNPKWQTNFYASYAAAALRAAADQIGPDGHDYSHGSIAELMWRGKREAGRELLAIADELEAQ